MIAPGWTDYGSNALKQFIPQGPLGPITWRGPLEIGKDSNEPQICGVIDDPMGLMTHDSTPKPYNHGDAVCWPNPVDGEPEVRATCVEQSW